MYTKYLKITVIILVSGFLAQACSTSSSDLSEMIRHDQRGILIWGGSPAVDGAGILFEAEEETYGAPGIKEDYSDYLPENKSRVQIEADIILTGETTVRGWGTEFPEIKFIHIKKIE